jgi:two-component system OmpR family response regulator
MVPAPRLARALEGEGYAVDAVRSGSETLSALGAERFDLVVLDIDPSDIKGFEMLRKVRGAGHQMPILVLGPREAVVDRVQCLNLGADDYMVVPYAAAELMARVRALLRRYHGNPDPRITHGPLVLDCVARRAFFEDKPLDLGGREWAVLEVLLYKVGKIVSREALTESIAGWNEDLSPNAIEVYISRLRGKVCISGIRIRTVRGLGYLLERYPAMGTDGLAH